jgi:hypothetical protein
VRELRGRQEIALARSTPAASRSSIALGGGKVVDVGIGSGEFIRSGRTPTGTTSTRPASSG